ncbi:MAG: hypothetical protein D0433_01440 [Candidatus Thermochlorobacter aerophilum]|uniref:Uncharacterized protein n=1 Tax=Candidatus Thermochlorobacter aerophilus TaxID=1868324 RepID=A0A395M520_9BACT|nr:MAG: hypothetical protein D0433_01440 [Candidatus Thermochlorobacter aerophilum]
MSPSVGHLVQIILLTNFSLYLLFVKLLFFRFQLRHARGADCTRSQNNSHFLLFALAFWLTQNFARVLLPNS